MIFKADPIFVASLTLEVPTEDGPMQFDTWAIGATYEEAVAAGKAQQRGTRVVATKMLAGPRKPELDFWRQPVPQPT